MISRLLECNGKTLFDHPEQQDLFKDAAALISKLVATKGTNNSSKLVARKGTNQRIKKIHELSRVNQAHLKLATNEIRELLKKEKTYKELIELHLGTIDAIGTSEMSIHDIRNVLKVS